MLTVLLDTDLIAAAAPPSGVDLATSDTESDGPPTVRRRVAGQVQDPDAVDALVRSPHGTTRVNEAGQFLIRAEPGDEIVVDTDPPKTAVVPETGGVVLS